MPVTSITNIHATYSKKPVNSEITNFIKLLAISGDCITTTRISGLKIPIQVLKVPDIFASAFIIGGFGAVLTSTVG
jgi:hypothetical protein